MKIGGFEIIEPVPELRNTYAISMLRPWIDVGRVGTIALKSLENHFGAKELATVNTIMQKTIITDIVPKSLTPNIMPRGFVSPSLAVGKLIPGGASMLGVLMAADPIDPSTAWS